MEATAADPRYPIGKYQPQPFSGQQLQSWLHDIGSLPEMLEIAMRDLTEEQYEAPYREGGWKIRQLVHHIADSHINAYVRFKLALTEAAPVIKTYDEKLWAQTDDVETIPPQVSLSLLYALHARWSASLQKLDREDWDRTIFHPDHQKEISLWHLLGLYAWHGKHHVAHITTARQKNGW